MSTRLWAGVAVAATTLMVAGCSGPSVPDGCEVDLELTNAETGVSTSLTDAVAISVAEGAGYTVYASDFTPEEEVTFFYDPEVPAEGNLAFISLTVFNAEGEVPPIEEGQVIPAGTASGEHVLVVVHSTADDEYGLSSGANGQASVTRVGDLFCAEIEYEDEQKSLRGTVGAQVGATG